MFEVVQRHRGGALGIARHTGAPGRDLFGRGLFRCRTHQAGFDEPARGEPTARFPRRRAGGEGAAVGNVDGDAVMHQPDGGFADLGTANKTDHTMTDFLQLLFSGMATGAIYGLAALGYTLLWQASGTINFAQGEFVMLLSHPQEGAASGPAKPVPRRPGLAHLRTSLLLLLGSAVEN